MILCPSTARTCSAENGSIMPISAAFRRIQRSDLMLMYPLERLSSGFFHNDLRELAAPVTAAACQSASRVTSNIDERARALAVWGADHTGRAAVGFLTYPHIERQRAQQPHAAFGCHACTAPLAKDMFDVAAVRAYMQAHIL